jgi:hypothetical protein
LLLKPFVEQRKLLRRMQAEILLLMSNGYVAEAIDPNGESKIVGFAAVDVARGRTAFLREGELFPLQGVIALPIAVAIVSGVALLRGWATTPIVVAAAALVGALLQSVS